MWLIKVQMPREYHSIIILTLNLGLESENHHSLDISEKNYFTHSFNIFQKVFSLIFFNIHISQNRCLLIDLSSPWSSLVFLTETSLCKV